MRVTMPVLGMIAAAFFSWIAVEAAAVEQPAAPPLKPGLREAIEVRLVTVDVVALLSIA